MKNKINGRLLLISLIAIVMSVMATTSVYHRLFEERVRSYLRVSAEVLRGSDFVNNDLSGLDGNELRITLIEADGSVIYDNGASADGLDNHLSRPEIADAFAFGEGESVRRSNTMNKNTYYYALLLDSGEVLRVAMMADSLWAVFLSAAPFILLIVLFVVCVCVALSYYLTKQLVEPIEKMADKLNDADVVSPYRELEPFLGMLRLQHADILRGAKMRQDFSANVSHELKTPLTAISGYGELLQSDDLGREDQKHFAQEICKNANRLLTLINDIIDLSKLDHNEGEIDFEEVDLYECARECVDDLALSARQRGIALEFGGEPIYIRGNRELLKQVIENLVENGVRYNNAGGYVKVYVGHEHDRAVLKVKDNGIGIPLADQDRVFERFYRVDKSRSKATGGTGLGLAIVKHIVQLHDGHITLRSKQGVGTTITISF